ncbi:MAG: DHH family phosphoesterase, partial [Bacillota bacterium]
STTDRLEPVTHLLADEKVLNIDHHEDNSHYGELNYISPATAAVGQILYQLAEYLDWPLSKKAGESLALAVLADTGFFRYSNTDRSVLQMIESLMGLGVDIYQINRHLYGKERPEVLQLLGRALQRLSLTAEGKIAYFYLEFEDYSATGTDNRDKDGFVNYARDVDGVELGILFSEEYDGKVKVSFRSNEYLPANQLAAEFGGGGHPRAAGCSVETPLPETMENVLARAKTYVKTEE